MNFRGYLANFKHLIYAVLHRPNYKATIKLWILYIGSSFSKKNYVKHENAV
jgi:hypothetical protein